MKSLLDLSIPVFENGLALKGRSVEDLVQLQQELLGSVQEFAEKSQKEGYVPGTIEDARFALLAWLDEYIYTETALSLDWFSHSLTLKAFNDAAAGMTFFQKMDEQHRQADRLPVLMLYTRCLLMGFMGRYRLEDPGQIQTLIDNAVSKNRDIAAPRQPSLETPAGTLPKDRHGVGMLALSAGGLVLAVLVYLALAALSAG
jgi:type IV/VI secretion system ImpK/VasF family protein